ncbi:MAG: alpha/beta hydrolase [Bradymonadia bacterium]
MNAIVSTPVSTPEFTCERTVTVDGVMLGMRRYPRPGAQPVLVLHGLAQNLNGWDLPIPGHSFAHHLWAAGFDVWLGNFRGHGRDPHRSGDGAQAARIDDYGLLDVPAFLSRVRHKTGMAPLVVCHSMGGVATLMYLQGALYDSSGRVIHRPGLAQQRNSEVSGVVLVGVPPVLHWHARPGVASALAGRYYEYNTWFQGVFGRRLTRRILRHAPIDRVRAGWLAARGRWLAQKRGPVGRLTREVTHMMGQGAGMALRHVVWHPGNMSRALIEAETLHTLEDISVPVLEQFCDWIAHGTMRAHVADGRGPEGRDPHEYADYHHLVRTPALWVAGAQDRVVPPSIMRSHGLNLVGSADRGLLVLPGFGHNDLRIGLKAPEIVFPQVTRWLIDHTPPQYRAMRHPA